MVRFRVGTVRRESRVEGPKIVGRIARDAQLREELETAERLGISHKRLLGWEPTTTYTHDDAGRLISSVPEVEWDDEQREAMIALADLVDRRFDESE